MKVVKRKVYLKRARFRSGRNKQFKQQPLEALMEAINKKAPLWTQKHWPAPNTGASTPFESGTRCLYVTKIARRRFGKADGIYFEVGSYVYGKGENQIAVNMSGAEPDVQSGPIVDKNGQHRSILHYYRCAVLGESMIVQKQRGSGGIQELANLLTNLFRRYVDPDMPSLEFLDVMGAGLRDIIDQNGGVESVKISFVDSAADVKDSPFGKPLFDAAEYIEGYGRFTAEWEAGDGNPIDTESAISAFEEIDSMDGGIGKVSIKPFHGGWINDLGKYQAHDEIDVQINSSGIEVEEDVRRGLFKYLDRLRIPKGKKNWRIIRDDGLFNFGSQTVLVKK